MVESSIELGMTVQRTWCFRSFEQEKVAFFESVRSGFVEIHAREPERMKRLDATPSQDEVFAQALSYLQ